MKSIECIGLLLMLLAMPGCQQTLPNCNNPAEQMLDDYVSQRNCSNDSVVITIRQDRPDTELWILEERTATPAAQCDDQTPCNNWLEGSLITEPVFLARSHALVQINGYNFQCSGGAEGCYDRESIETERPESRVFESSYQIAKHPDGLSDWPLSFGPRNANGIPIHLGDAHTEPEHKYNVVGSNSPLMQGGECSDWGWFSKHFDQVTAIGYGQDPTSAIIIMAYLKDVWVNEACSFMTTLGVTDAALMDGSDSAGMYLNSNQALDGNLKGSDRRRIPYRIGLVTLESTELKRVANGNFEEFALSARPSETPTGFHHYKGQLIEQVQWSGGMFLYDARRYFEHAWRTGSLPVASHGLQVAALRPRSSETNHIMQSIEVPANRYCMLHFFHGFHPASNGCTATESSLRVHLENTSNGSEDHQYTSFNVNSLDEVWLRFTTSNEGHDVGLTFIADDPIASPTCEVLLDDISVSCAL